MALRVQNLNADTTFLLTFTPPFAPDKSTKKRFPGDFTILIDPWLSGHSSILHPTFQISHHTSEPAITNLKDIRKQIDLIIISQDKADHCHKETLCSLPQNSRINILATPAAAKKVRSWKHFGPKQVHVMNAYNPSDPDTIIRIPLQAYSSASADGEITIANIPAKFDVTGLHNAIGITYQPPSSVFTLNTQFSRYEEGTTVKLDEKGISRPSTAPQRPQTASSAAEPPMPKHPLSKTTSNPNTPAMPIPQDSTSPTRIDSGIARSSSSQTNREKTLSIIYTPHGVQPRILKPYLQSHLKPLNALPVSALLHSINVEANPWFMGGQIAAGAPGGVELLKAIGGSANWIGAHDEVKENKGVATTWIKSRQFEVDEVKGMLESAGVRGVKIHRLDVGEVLRIPPKHEVDKREEKAQQSLEVEDDWFAIPESVVTRTTEPTGINASKSLPNIRGQARIHRRTAS